MSDDRIESRLVLAIVRERWDEVDAICARETPDADALLRVGRGCDVEPWLHARLHAAGRLRTVGERAAERLGEARRKCRADNLLLLARLEQALDVLRGRDIVPVVLKGVAVLHQFDVGFDERRLDDVDFLVARRDFEASVEALRDAGWTSPPEREPRRWLGESFEESLLSPGPVPVLFDVHSHIAQRPRYRVEIEDVLSRTVEITVAGRAALRLEDHDQAAHVLLHHVQHYFDRRLKWAIDFRSIAAQNGFDWERLGRRLAEWGGTSAGAMSLRHIHKLLPEAVPPEALAAIPVARWRRWITGPLRSGHPLDLFRGTRRRAVQLYLGAALVEDPRQLAAAFLHRPAAPRPDPPG